MQVICDDVNVYCILPHAFQQLSSRHGFCHRSGAHQAQKPACTQRAKTEFLKSITTKLVYRKFERIKTMNTLFAAPSSRLNSWSFETMDTHEPDWSHDGLHPVSMTTEEEVHTTTIATMMNFDNPSTMTSCGSC